MHRQRFCYAGCKAHLEAAAVRHSHLLLQQRRRHAEKREPVGRVRLQVRLNLLPRGRHHRRRSGRSRGRRGRRHRRNSRLIHVVALGAGDGAKGPGRGGDAAAAAQALAAAIGGHAARVLRLGRVLARVGAQRLALGPRRRYADGVCGRRQGRGSEQGSSEHRCQRA